MNPLIDVANLVIGVLALIVVSVTLGYFIKQDKREKARQNEAADDAEWAERFEHLMRQLPNSRER